MPCLAGILSATWFRFACAGSSGFAGSQRTVRAVRLEPDSTEPNPVPVVP